MLHKVLVTNIARAIGQHGSSHLASQAASRQCSISLWCVVENVLFLFVWHSSVGFVIISLLCDIFPLKMKLMADQSQETPEHMTAVCRNINIFIHRCRIMNRTDLMCPLHQNFSATKETKMPVCPCSLLGGGGLVQCVLSSPESQHISHLIVMLLVGILNSDIQI